MKPTELKERQKYALTHPVENPVPTSAPDANYKKIAHIGGLKLSTLLTVDTFDGAPRWHLSVSVLSPKDGRPLNPFGNITVEENGKVMEYMMNTLAGVGTGKLSTTLPRPIYHMFKDLSAGEMLVLAKYSVARN